MHPRHAPGQMPDDAPAGPLPEPATFDGEPLSHAGHETGAVKAKAASPRGDFRLRRLERLHPALVVFAFILVYVLLDSLVYHRPKLPMEPAILSLHAGLGYILILAFGQAYLPCVILVPMLSEWLVDQTVMPVLIEVPRDLLTGAASALVIRMLLHHRLRFDPTLNSLRSITLLFAAAGLDSLFAAIILDLSRYLAEAPNPYLLWRNIGDLWVARFTGIILVAPLGVLLLRGRWTALRTSDWCIHIGAIVGLFVVLMGFGEPQPLNAFYLFLLPIVWMATRGGLEAASLGLAVTQCGLIIVTWLLPSGSLDLIGVQSRLLVLTLTGLVVGALVVERLQFEQQLRVHQDALARMTRIASMSQLTSSIAHEINQPLMAAGTYTRLVTKALAGQPEHREVWAAAEKAQFQILRAGEVIRRLRALFRLDRSDYRPHDLPDMLLTSIELCQAELERRGVTCRLLIPETLPHILVDRMQIEQVFVNLIQNAAQAIGSDGMIRITARRGAKGLVEVLFADDGPGLPQDLTAGQPVPFFTTKEDGIGVGLALSRTIIEAHGGELVLSNGTSGAQVTILLPLNSGRVGDGHG